MIKYIVHTTSAYSDLNGNTYHFAKITSTKTGKSLVVSPVGGVDNAAHLLLRRNGDSKPLVNDWREIYSAQSWEKKREWQRLERFAQNRSVAKYYEGDVTATIIRRLNRKEQDATQD